VTDALSATPPREGRYTTQFSIVDSGGNAVPRSNDHAIQDRMWESQPGSRERSAALHPQPTIVNRGAPGAVDIQPYVSRMSTIDLHHRRACPRCAATGEPARPSVAGLQTVADRTNFAAVLANTVMRRRRWATAAKM